MHSNSGVFRPNIAKNRKDWLVFSTKALRPRASLSRQEQTIALRSNIGVEQLKKEVQDLREIEISKESISTTRRILSTSTSTI